MKSSIATHKQSHTLIHRRLISSIVQKNKSARNFTFLSVEVSNVDKAYHKEHVEVQQSIKLEYYFVCLNKLDFNLLFCCAIIITVMIIISRQKHST